MHAEDPPKAGGRGDDRLVARLIIMGRQCSAPVRPHVRSGGGWQSPPCRSLGPGHLTVAVTSDCPCPSDVSLGEQRDSDAGSDYCLLCHDQCACRG
jgi:hypothetical protein